MSRVMMLMMAVLAAYACGGGGGPTAPSVDAQVQLPGVVTNTVTGQPVGGAKVLLSDGGSEAVAGPDGTFLLTQVTGGADVTLRTEAGGYWPRVLVVRTPRSEPLNIDIIPDGDGFNLTFFDYVFRDQGTRGTTRLPVPPTFRIYPQQFRCAVHWEGGGCADWFCANLDGRITVESPIPEFVEAVRQVIQEDSGLLTGGFAANPAIEIGRTYEEGSSLTLGELFGFGPVVSWVFLEDAGCAGMAGQQLVEVQPSSLSGRWLGFRRSTIAHELAHVYGFKHPVVDGRLATPLCSVMGGCANFEDWWGKPTAADILHGRINYMRPAGTTSPDTSLKVIK